MWYLRLHFPQSSTHFSLILYLILYLILSLILATIPTIILAPILYFILYLILYFILYLILYFILYLILALSPSYLVYISSLSAAIKKCASSTVLQLYPSLDIHLIPSPSPYLKTIEITYTLPGIAEPQVFKTRTLYLPSIGLFND